MRSIIPDGQLWYKVLQMVLSIQTYLTSLFLSMKCLSIYLQANKI